LEEVKRKLSSALSQAAVVDSDNSDTEDFTPYSQGM
jgi:hypothetical protein